MSATPLVDNGAGATSSVLALTRPARKRGRTPRPKPAPTEPSREARQRAALILEVLAGGRTPAQAAQALAVSVPRYYLLEERGLQGLLTACEPAPRGAAPDPQQAQEALRRECERWKRESARQQALLRAAQRSLGLTAPPAPTTAPAKEGNKRRRARKPVVRALKAAARLKPEAEAPPEASTMPPSEA